MHVFVDQLNSIVWSPVLVYLLLGVGLFFSVKTRFVQVRFFREMLRLTFSKKDVSGAVGVSSFQALAISLSGRVGTGNIAGVAAAIGFGGPGAVFWMWVVAFLGAATSYIECTLGQIYKEQIGGEYRGGPAFYLEKFLGLKWYGWLFAISTIIATGFLLPGVQANSISKALENAAGPGASMATFAGDLTLTSLLCGALIVVALAIIVFGGIKRIAHFAQVVVPFMALAYIVFALAVVAINIQELPGVIMLILGDALTPMAGLGAAIGWGVKRGVYSNEAGQGSGPHAAAAAEVQHPSQQGLVQAFSVFIDTLFVCSATAFIILITGAYNVHGSDGGFLIQNLSPDMAANSPAFTQTAIESVFPGIGSAFVALAITFFAFTTILAYYYIAETNVIYLQTRLNIKGLSWLLKFGMMASVFYGAIKTAGLAWALGDLGVGIMAWLNVVGILIIFFVGKPAMTALKDYENQKREGVEEYTFNPERLGIKRAYFWK